MRALSFFIFMIGVIMITMGYMDNKLQKKIEENKIEYRFVPRTLYDEQHEPSNISRIYSDMFADQDPIFDS